jgi:4-hydroxythreonine-4-phosphate dehydrogenase
MSPTEETPGTDRGGGSSRALVVTSGDPRGIGPEVVRRAVMEFSAHAEQVPLILVGDEDSLAGAWPDGVETERVGGFDGSITSAGEVTLAAIRRAVDLIRAGRGGALVTGPVHKPALHAAGARVPGQTELLGTLTGADRVGMLMHARTTRLSTHPLRILLATTHLSLREVPDRLDATLLEGQVRLLHDSLRDRWGMERPAIGLCGLNPHASDGGLFGSEEAEIMEPLVRRLRAEELDLRGPRPADTVFLGAVEGELDAVIVPYHDVGMAVFKTVAFGRGVNVTLGLPFLRTSPDHGTAFDLVGTARADHGSTLEALRLAADVGLPHLRPAL